MTDMCCPFDKRNAIQTHSEKFPMKFKYFCVPFFIFMSIFILTGKKSFETKNRFKEKKRISIWRFVLSDVLILEHIPDFSIQLHLPISTITS